MEVKINLSFSEIHDRIPIHCGIKDYIENSINDNLSKSNIILKKDHVMYIEFTRKSYYDKIEYVESPSSKKDSFRLFTCYVPLTYFETRNDTVNTAFANLLLDASLFILETHVNGITKVFIENLKTNLNFQLIDSFAFPAPFENQKYVGDEKFYTIYGHEIPKSIVLGYLAT